ncbi:hypothetical protein LCGC14_0249630 [marine sediment metagenome]|uniref:Uncharacterized protein n=1 Tax=marine sediment metagenome TaxID=412755 RepID=A0A0F9U591_9ZZZZ
MLGWFKRLLRCWLLVESRPSMILEVVLGGDIQKVVVSKVVGNRILCTIPGKGESACHLIGIGQAVDKKHFQELLKTLGGDEWFWPDGSVANL